MTYWNVKVYDDDGNERETIRGLSYSTVEGILRVFHREGIEAQAMEYDDDGSMMLNSKGVNLS